MTKLNKSFLWIDGIWNTLEIEKALDRWESGIMFIIAQYHFRPCKRMTYAQVERDTSNWQGLVFSVSSGLAIQNAWQLTDQMAWSPFRSCGPQCSSLQHSPCSGAWGREECSKRTAQRIRTCGGKEVSQQWCQSLFHSNLPLASIFDRVGEGKLVLTTKEDRHEKKTGCFLVTVRQVYSFQDPGAPYVHMAIVFYELSVLEFLS